MLLSSLLLILIIGTFVIDIQNTSSRILLVYGIGYLFLLIFIFNISNNLDIKYIFCDPSQGWELYIQDNTNSKIEMLVELHDSIVYHLLSIVFIISWVGIFMTNIFVKSNSPISNKYLNHGTLIELIWTITPALILVLIAFPSFKLLYLMDEVTDPSLSVLAEGNQWYWSHEYTGIFNMTECTSPSNATEEFKGLEVIIKDGKLKSKLSELRDITTISEPSIDLSNINNLLRELKTNMSSMNEMRISNIKKEIDANFIRLNKIAASHTHGWGLDFFRLYTFFMYLKEFKEFNPYLTETMNKANEFMDIENVRPSLDLIESDPVKYWEDMTRYANRAHNKNVQTLTVLKNYTKDNGLFSETDKTMLFTVINNMKKGATNIANVDKAIFKEQLANSKILKELYNSKN